MATTLHHPGHEALGDQPSVEERRALIERVAASEQFTRAARLRDFLLYVGKHSLKDGSPEIHEQEIGAKVFGRPETYDTSQDNIVRVNATELRKRIELYFATEGVHEPLILEIPRGGYKPIFHWRLPEVESHRASAIEEILPVTAARRSAEDLVQRLPRLNSHILWAAVCLLLAITCAVLFEQNRAMQKTLHPWEDKPAVAAFWGDFLSNNQQTDIVLPDDSASVIENITHHRITLGDYLSRSFLQQIQSSDFSADRKADLDEVFNHNLITFGGVLAAQRIIALDPFSLSLHLTASRFYEADLLKRDNAILIGGKKANPWVFLFDDQLNFNLDTAGAGMFVVNNHPQAGEQAVYTEFSSQKGPVGYSVVAYLPNPSRTGNTIIVAGTDSDASSAAAEFLTSEEQLQKFRNIIHADRFPYFEVLLKTSEVRGTSFNAEIVAYRTYPGLR
ncbi:MAG: hypothetical protein ABR990_00505 [Terracidiphilus sp.]|jgi:hypothetical protein